MLAKYKVKQNCFFNFRNFSEGEIVLVEEEMGRKMKGLLEPHERIEKKETREQAYKPKSKTEIRKPAQVVSRAKAEQDKKAEADKKKTSGTVNYNEQLTYVVDDDRTAENGGNRTKPKKGRSQLQNGDITKGKAGDNA